MRVRSIHLKSFAFLCVWADVRPISRRCNGLHEHVVIQGAYTKKSATYVDGLSDALADVMELGIKRLETLALETECNAVDGIENQLVNEVALSSSWKVVSSWTYRVSAHINILELAAVLRLVTRLVKEGSSKRIVILVDSNVVRCACSSLRDVLLQELFQSCLPALQHYPWLVACMWFGVSAQLG